MKKYALTLLSIALIATSCSKDDAPVQPAPYKVTGITCLKDGSTNFKMDIVYKMEDNNLSQVTHLDRSTDNYRYQSNEIYVINDDQKISATYTVSGDKITKYSLEMTSEITSGSFTYEEFEYKYDGNTWKETDMKWSRIIDGKLENFKSNVDHVFTWSNSNITRYTAGNNYIDFEYTNEKTPENYPFRILNDTNLEDGSFEGGFIGEENFLPLNLKLGRNTNNLVKSAKWYKARSTDKLGEYTFDYSINSNGYVTTVNMKEIIYDSEGNQKETNSYIINLSYEYNPNK